MLNYPKAREYLEESLRLKPNQPRVQLMLADTLMALNRVQEALPPLQALETTGYEPGQVAYLRGMAEAKEGRYSQALDYFQKAQVDPKIAQEAKFQASLALAALNRLKEARQTMQEAVVLNPQSPTGEFAQRYQGILGKPPQRAETLPGERYCGLRLRLQRHPATGRRRGGDPGLPAKGTRSSPSATFEYNFNAQGPLSLLTQYSYYQNFHPTITNYDVLGHYVAAVPTYSYKSGRLLVASQLQLCGRPIGQVLYRLSGDSHLTPYGYAECRAGNGAPFYP